MRTMTIAFIIFACFFGMSVLILSLGACIMVGRGRWTLPGTNDNRLRTAQVNVDIAELRRQRLLIEDGITAMAEAAVRQAIESGREREREADVRT